MTAATTATTAAQPPAAAETIAVLDPSTGEEIGTIPAGDAAAADRAGDLRKALLELGGKDPLIVDAGVDPEWAAGQAAAGAFANAGQLCTSVERIYVDESVAEPFL